VTEADQLSLYRDLPALIGCDAEDPERLRLAIEAAPGENVRRQPGRSRAGEDPGATDDPPLHSRSLEGLLLYSATLSHKIRACDLPRLLLTTLLPIWHGCSMSCCKRVSPEPGG
jgi:hypothetical protein